MPARVRFAREDEERGLRQTEIERVVALCGVHSMKRKGRTSLVIKSCHSRRLFYFLSGRICFFLFVLQCFRLRERECPTILAQDRGDFGGRGQSSFCATAKHDGAEATGVGSRKIEE